MSDRKPLSRTRVLWWIAKQKPQSTVWIVALLVWSVAMFVRWLADPSDAGLLALSTLGLHFAKHEMDDLYEELDRPTDLTEEFRQAVKESMARWGQAHILVNPGDSRIVQVPPRSDDLEGDA